MLIDLTFGRLGPGFDSMSPHRSNKVKNKIYDNTTIVGSEKALIDTTLNLTLLNRPMAALYNDRLIPIREVIQNHNNLTHKYHIYASKNHGYHMLTNHVTFKHIYTDHTHSHTFKQIKEKIQTHTNYVHGKNA